MIYSCNLRNTLAITVANDCRGRTLTSALRMILSFAVVSHICKCYKIGKTFAPSGFGIYNSAFDPPPPRALDC